MIVSANSGSPCSDPSRQYLNGREDKSVESSEYEEIDTLQRLVHCSLTELRDGLGVDGGAHSDRLRPEQVHHLWATNTLRETRADQRRASQQELG